MHIAQIKIKFEKGDYDNANIQSLTQYANRGDANIQWPCSCWGTRTDHSNMLILEPDSF